MSFKGWLKKFSELPSSSQQEIDETREELSAIKSSLLQPQKQVVQKDQELTVPDWFNRSLVKPESKCSLPHKFVLSAIKTITTILLPQKQVVQKDQELKVPDWINRSLVKPESKCSLPYKFDLSAIKSSLILPQKQVVQKDQELKVPDWFNRSLVKPESKCLLPHKFVLSAIKSSLILPQKQVVQKDQQSVSTKMEATAAKSNVRDKDLVAKVMTEQQAFYNEVTKRC